MHAKIVIADDSASMRLAVRSLLLRLRPDWEICGEACDGEQAMRAVLSLHPDVLVIDVGMPGINGLEVASRIAKMGLGSRVLLFSSYESAGMLEAIRSAGAQGYVDKANAVRDLVIGIESVLAGNCFWNSHST
jgi:DNA-binding NarL/FixJ family response regulator